MPDRELHDTARAVSDLAQQLLRLVEAGETEAAEQAVWQGAYDFPAAGVWDE